MNVVAFYETLAKLIGDKYGVDVTIDSITKKEEKEDENVRD